MGDSSLNRLLVQSSHYSLTSVFTMVAGLVTFPILTRIFSVADYGVMNLVAATLSIAVALGKVGIQHSIVRYESEIRASNGRYTLAQLYSTTLFGMMATAVILMFALVVGAQLVPAAWLGDPRLRWLFAIASLLIIVQVVESVLINILRAEQETTTLMKYQVLKKYLGLGIVLFAVLVVSSSLVAFYTASVVSEGLAVVVLARLLFGAGRRPRPRPAQFSRPLYVELIGFGIPMMIGYEVAGIVLSVGDRYVIQGMIGATPLGLYAVAYNLSQYIQAAFIASVGQAITPIYMRMWSQQGADETSAFIAHSLRTYVVFAAPLIAGLAAVGPELLTFLASDKYASAGVVLPWVIAGMAFDGTLPMVGAGLFIHRKTRIIMAIVLGAAILNVGLNLLLVPRLGIRGAAMATLISYALTSMAMAMAGRRLLRVALPWATIVRAGLAALVMYLALKNILPDRRLLTVVARIAIGAPTYCFLMALVDADARALLRKAVERVRRK